MDRKGRVYVLERSIDGERRWDAHWELAGSTGRPEKIIDADVMRVLNWARQRTNFVVVQRWTGVSEWAGEGDPPRDMPVTFNPQLESPPYEPPAPLNQD